MMLGRCQMVREGVIWCKEGVIFCQEGVRKVLDVIKNVSESCQKKCQNIARKLLESHEKFMRVMKNT